MAHICDYIIKQTRPKKPIVILYGASSEFVTFFKKPTDITCVEATSGLITAHALTAPLFMEVSTLWVDGIANLTDLKALCLADVQQPIIFNLPSDAEEPELSSDWAKKIQVVSKGRLTPGGKPHKEFLTWILEREFTLKKNVAGVLVEKVSPIFGDDFLRAADSLSQLLYLFPESAFFSGSVLEKILEGIPVEKLIKLLNPKKTPHISGVLDTFFDKSHLTYHSVQRYYQYYDSPLPLLKAMTDKTRVFINCAWAIRSSKATKQSPLGVAQGLRVHKNDFEKYDARVHKYFGEQILWDLAKDLCITQSRYRLGEKSQLPLYSLLMRYIGVGL